MTPRELFRLLRVARVLVRHGMLDLVPAPHRGRARWAARLLLVRPAPALADTPRGERLVQALTVLGPMFVKFGQVLSTRRDLVPADVADALAGLQDQVAPFPGGQARAAVERALGAPVAQLFSHFDEAPLASASIAQVHAAGLFPRQREDGSFDPPAEVVVKVLRPDIAERASADIALLRSLAALVRRFHPAADKLRPDEVVDELEDTLRNELDLEREAANASLLGRNFRESPDLKVPAVVWSHTRAGVLTLERVYGIPVDDLTALDAAGIDRKALAAKGVRLFYEQVFRDNFFHADAHAGNIWVDPDRRDEPRFIALDFGIMGSLPDEDRYWLAENFLALFRNDYARIAELHVRAGWMPADVRMDELEAAIRTVCEPYFTRPLSEISLAELVMKLFETARRYQLTLQPQLILLQKTLLNIEGVGRMLDPQIDIWAVARPVLERIWRRRHGPRAALRSLRRHVPEWLTAAPRVPGLVHQLLADATSGKLELRVASGDLKALEARLARGQRAAFWRGAGFALALLAVVLGLFIEGGRPAGLAAAVAALVAFLVAGRLSALPPSTRSIRRSPT